MKTKRFVLLIAILTAAVGLAGCASAPETADWPQMPGYDPMRVPDDNAMTAEKVALGHQLYYDARLSGDGQRSCYGCHLEDNGLTDGRATALGAFDKELTRSSPTLWNIGYHSEFYWDGRSSALEKQVKGAWSGGNMGASGKDGAPSMDDICTNLNEIEGYRTQFAAVFGEGESCTSDNVAKAIASFMRTIVATDSAWARYRSGDVTALSEQARSGYEVFKGKARCTNCHDGALLTDLQYHNVGVGMDDDSPDLGRYKVSEEEKDKGAFKTPTLLDISRSAPYTHNGSARTLEAAVKRMLLGGFDNPWLDTANLRPAVELTDEEFDDLMQFLNELTVEYNIEEPTLPE